MMKKTAKKNSPIMTLYEEIDVDYLRRIISAKELDSDLRLLLKAYLKKCSDPDDEENRIIPIKVQYFYSDKLEEKGRLYAKNGLSLQNFNKIIRHPLARQNYFDIDMENSFFRLISQYCNKNNIECHLLEQYVEKREKVLSQIMKLHDIDRNSAKELMIALSYGGSYEINGKEPKTKLRYVEGIQEQLKQISSKISKIEKVTYELVKRDKTKTNPKASTLSIVYQELENECLMAMYDFFTGKGLEIGTLCFDGFLLKKVKRLPDELIDQNAYDQACIESDQEEKQKLSKMTKENVEKLLIKCEKYVKKTTEYNIKLAVKEMDMKPDFKIPDFSNYVTSDADAQEKLFKIEGKEKFKFCDEVLYIYDEDTGLYSTSIYVLYSYLTRNKKFLKIIVKDETEKTPEKTKSYGEDTKLMRDITEQVKKAARDNEWLEKTKDSSLNKLLFMDGIYDMNTENFTIGFDPKIVFHVRIPHKFPEYNPKEVRYAKKLSLDQFFDDPEPMIYALGRALAGGNTGKRFYMGPGTGYNGKTALCKILFSVFGELIGNINGECLSITPGNDTRDPAAKLRWAMLIRHKRIYLYSELNMGRKLDGAIIKKISGGDILTGRTHGGEEVSFELEGTVFSLLNDIPEIEPLDEPCQERIEFITFPHKFVNPEEVDKKPYYRAKDPDFNNKIKNPSFINGFIHLILDGYKDFLKNGEMKFNQKIKEKWLSNNVQSIKIEDLIKKSYEITNQDNDRVNVKDLIEWKTREKQLKLISNMRFNEMVKEKLGLSKMKSGNDRFWIGIRKLTIVEI